MIKGIAASPGIAIGKAYVLRQEDTPVPKREIRESDVPSEIVRFEEALIKTRSDILETQKKISTEIGESYGEIFTAHRMVLEDRAMIEEVISKLKKEQLCVEYIFSEVLKKYTEVFSRIDDEYLKERVSDIHDVGRRLLRNLLGKEREILSELKEEVIVVAHDLSPSDTAMMHKERVIAFVTDIGGRTSHTAIMARSLEIPAVVGLEVVTRTVKNGDLLIVDGNHGVIGVNPDSSVLNEYKKEKEAFKEFEKGLLKLKDLPSQTLDGHVIELAANIELPEEIPSVLAHGANGIGLFRTEFFYLNRKDLPTEDEQYEAYKYVASQASPNHVIIRTLDLGGDKFISHLDFPIEMNPFLGWRAIRFCLAKPDIFKMQLRAILRASIHGNLKVMYPMISGVEELREANGILNEVREDLRSKGVPFAEKMEVGAMIEIPSAAMVCDILAHEVDFFSIGTNDLIQYSLAVDRINEKVAYLYEPTHPAILRLIKRIIEAGHTAGKWVGMCGEMVSEPHMALLLLGLGLDEFSISPVAIPQVKDVVRSVYLSQAKDIAREALNLKTGKEVDIFLRNKLKELVPNLRNAKDAIWEEGHEIG